MPAVFQPSRRSGIGAGVAAYLLWGVLPVYWKALQTVSAPQILAHRIVWSFVFLAALLAGQRGWSRLRASVTGRALRLYAVAAVLLGTNWLTYIWAVNAGHIVDTSLGYYINPIVSVVLAVAFLRERLRRLQWLAVMLAASGVIFLTVGHGRPPWIALVLAGTFGLYGLVKKLAPLGPQAGLTLETATLTPAALVGLAWLGATGAGAFGRAGPTITALLILAGPVTSLPLLLFARAAQTVPLATLGLLQYLSPTCGLLLGVGLYGESFDRTRGIAFGLIWVALALYWLEGFVVGWRARRDAVR